MKSYHGSSELKARFTAHVARHRVQDQVVRGTYGKLEAGQWRGCAVGCSLRSLDEIEGRALHVDNNSHADLAERLGIPLVLAHLEDRIFEDLPQTDAMLWPTLFAQAIPVGADLSLVWPRFAHWLLADETSGVIRFARSDAARAAIRAVAELFARQIRGETVSAAEWRTDAAYAAAATYATAAATYAATYAAYAATYAADAAADAAYAAYAAAYAAYAAYDAAYAAADARKAHFKTMAEALLRFMSEAQ